MEQAVGAIELTDAPMRKDAQEAIKLVRNEIRALGSPQASAPINGDKIARGWTFPIESALAKKENAMPALAMPAMQFNNISVRNGLRLNKDCFCANRNFLNHQSLTKSIIAKFAQGFDNWSDYEAPLSSQS